MDTSKNPAKTKPTFYNICHIYDLDYQTLQTIAKTADVSMGVIDTMFVDDPVSRTEARKLMGAVSAHVGKEWHLADMKVALLPTFDDICTIHQLDIARLAEDADVSYTTLLRMLGGGAVPSRCASCVLQAVSKQGHTYTLDNVDIPLEEVQPTS